jgi:tight adherence protein C
MMVTIIFGLVLFVVLLALCLRMVPRPTAAGVQMQEVTQELRARRRPAKPFAWDSMLNADIIARAMSPLRRVLSSKPDEDLTYRLMLAGYRKPAHAEIFLGARLALPAFMGAAVALLVDEGTMMWFFVTVGLGFFMPQFWLSRAITKRRRAIELSLPDALDLLAICMEAGMGLDQGMVRVGQELKVSHAALSEELLQINFEQRAGMPRIEAWKGFADRSDVESIRSFVAMLIQTDRFGTPISKSLAAFSDALRTQRRQKAEEQAAKATIKLVPPLVFFIFPSVGIVLVGPAVIMLMKNMEHIVK